MMTYTLMLPSMSKYRFHREKLFFFGQAKSVFLPLFHFEILNCGCQEPRTQKNPVTWAVIKVPCHRVDAGPCFKKIGSLDEQLAHKKIATILVQRLQEIQAVARSAFWNANATACLPVLQSGLGGHCP